MLEDVEQSVPPNRKEVRWLLVWAGLFVWFYPTCKFIFSTVAALFGPSKSLTPAGDFAFGMAVVWTFMIYWNLENGRKLPRTPVHSKPAMPIDVRRRRKILFSIATCAGILLIGGASRLFLSQPSWMLIAACAIAIPLSLFASNYLIKQSNLGSQLRPPSQV